MTSDRDKMGPQPDTSAAESERVRAWNRKSPGSRSAFSESRTRIGHLVRKEFLQILRHKQNLRMLIIAPIFQLLLFGYACRLDVKEVATVVVDMDRSTVSRQVIDAFSRSGYFVIKARLSSYDQVDYYLDRGLAAMALLIPPDLERRVNGQRTAEVGVLIDGVDTTMASTVSGYASAILAQFSLELMQDRIGWARGLRLSADQPDLIIPSISGESRAWFNPNLDSKYFFVPGVLALILTFMAITVPAMAIVREKETGTIEQIMVTPITRLELILGKIIPAFIILVTNLTVLTVLAFIVFHPIFRGSLVFFFFSAILFIITYLGIGTTISSFCRTQQQAILSSFMVLQPSAILSGFAFPIENMPPIIQYLTYLNPLRYFIVILRQVFLKGLGWEALWPQLVPIMIMGVVFIALAAFLFKKKID